MTAAAKPFSPATVKGLTTPGFHRDPGARNLYIQVTATQRPTGVTYGRSWVFIWKERAPTVSATGKVYRRHRYLGLGSCLDVTPNKARDLAIDYRRIVLAGGDPIAVRRKTREKAQVHTLHEVCALYYANHKDEWSNEKYRQQWLTGLENHVLSRVIDGVKLGHRNIADFDRALAHVALESVWEKLPKTAADLRARLQAVWTLAKAKGWCGVGENPFALENGLGELLGRLKRDKGHYAALPYADIRAFMAELRSTSVVANAIDPIVTELCILTALRTDAVLPALVGEIDLTRAVWTVPKHRAKGKLGKRQEFKCPLSHRCIELLTPLVEGRAADEYLFVSERGKPLSPNAMLDFIQQFKRTDSRSGQPITMHGFRSTFADWAYDTGNYPDGVIEQALQHAEGNKVKAAYRRGDAFALRMSLMADWAKECG